MPQLSLYVTDSNMALLRSRAHDSGVSMSKYVNNLIERDSKEGEWPIGFWSLYGALTEDIVVPEDVYPTDDEELSKLFA